MKVMVGRVNRDRREGGRGKGRDMMRGEGGRGEE